MHATPPPAAADSAEQRIGSLLVFGAALVWSFGGVIGRFLVDVDPWTTVFWRSAWASLFLLAFMLVRDGMSGTRALIGGLRLPAIAVALCFATASTSFIVALQHTSVTNILLMQASTPLLAALIAWLAYRQRVDPPTWIAIAAVMTGVAVMVSDSFEAAISPIGDALAFLIALMFAIAVVLTRRYSNVRMTPAVWLGATLACVVAASMASGFAVSTPDMGLLFVFGALNLGLGLALFATGARMIPAALAALIGAAEPVLGPIWVWVVHHETLAARTLIGGAIVLCALLANTLYQYRRS